MLVFINPELMNINGETENRKNGGSPYYKISCDGSSLVTPKDPNRPNTTRPILRMACNATVQTQGIGIDNKRIIEFIDLPTSYSARDNGKGVSILVRELEEENKRDIYVVAFPFHGVLKPLPKSEDYDVLKGMIVVSGSYSIPYGNYSYKNILYLVVSPKGTGLVSLNLESYCLKSNKKKGVSVTMHEVMNIDLNRIDSTFNIWDEETEPMNMEQYKDIPVWELAPIPPVERKPRPRRNDRPFPVKEGSNSNSGNRNQRVYGKRPDNIKGGATPSGGFAKSAPVHHNALPQAPKDHPLEVHEPLSTHLDSMIENALNGGKYPAKKKKGRR